MTGVTLAGVSIVIEPPLSVVVAWPHARTLYALLLTWLATGGLMLWAATWPPVSRTQEARVLETAREMAERPVGEWAIPKLNGAVRLRKPPLAYWMAAASFRVFGVSDFTGRLPNVLLAWVTLGATFAIARRLFDTRAAFFAAATLAGSWLFFRLTLSAETDGPTTAFLVLGVYCALRAFDAPIGRDLRWQHALAACCALAILTKGPPAMYLALFVVGLCLIRRQWRPAWRFLTSGAIVTLLVISVPWFAYVARHTADEGQLGVDLLNSAEGGDHSGPPWAYGPMLLKATLPWTFVWLAALWTAAFALAREWKTRFAATTGDTLGLLTISVWGLAVLLPLCVWGNKQEQYLLPVMPPTMILIGWALAGVTRRQPWATAAAIFGYATAAVLVVLGVSATAAFVVIRKQDQSPFTPGDATLLTVLFAVAVVTALQVRRGPRAFLPMATVLAGAVMFVPLAWLPYVTGGRSRDAAIEVLGEYPAAAKFFFRGTELPVMSWSMRRAVPLLSEKSIEAAAADPATVVLEQQQDDEHEPTPPAGYERHQTIKQRENTLHVFVPAKH